MITFSIAAVLLSALAAVLILQRASGAARNPDADPTLAVYRRQLSEIDDLAERGLLAEGELKAARAEAARRLLGAAKAVEAAPAEAAQPRVSRALRLAVLAGAVAAPALAAALYVTLGKPGLHDQPFARRLDAWKQGDPSQLTAGEMAAVLQTVVKSRPNDAEPLTYLARAQLASGNVPAAAESMRKAVRLHPDDGGLWANLGILLLLEGQGEETQPAQAAFRNALKFDPKSAPARYHLARARIASGDVNGGLADWRALAADLPPEAPERQQLEQEIAATAKAGHLVAQPKATPAPEQQQAEAGGGAPEALAGALTGQAPAAGGGGAPDPRQMVAQLAARLEQDPNNLAGWARLIRSYAVLGDPDKMKQAQDRARQIFKGQAEALKAIDSAATAPQGAE
ncbi:MAG: c-type cytochrome biogenesis protein CcmI [Caulobacteraceae bacterium]